jgi:DNA-binding transcriptional LysR family regulator
MSRRCRPAYRSSRHPPRRFGHRRRRGPRARGRLIVQEASTLLATVSEIGAAPSGIVRIMLPVGLPPHLLTPLFAMVSAGYPRLTFRVRFGNDPVEGLLEDVDLAVHFGTQSPQGPWISHEPLRVRVWLIASKDYLARRATPRSIEDLAGHDLFAWEVPGEDGHRWPTKTGGTFNVTPRLLSPEIHWLCQCVIAGSAWRSSPTSRYPISASPRTPWSRSCRTSSGRSSPCVWSCRRDRKSLPPELGPLRACG